MALVPPFRPKQWSCPTTEPKTARASCESIDKLNDYGVDGTVATGVSVDLARIDANDPAMQMVRARNAKAGIKAPELSTSASIVIDTTAWVSSEANQKPEATLSPMSWLRKGQDVFVGNSSQDVLDALQTAKRNAAQFARNVYVASDGQVRDPESSTRLMVRIVPGDETTAKHQMKLLDGHIGPWSEQDNLRLTPQGIDIVINSKTLEVPTADQLTAQWNKGLQFDKEQMRDAWQLLNPGGDMRAGMKLMHAALKKTLEQVAAGLTKDLGDLKTALGKGRAEGDSAVKDQLTKIVRRESVPRGGAAAPSPGGKPATGASPAPANAPSTSPDSVDRIIAAMSHEELRAFVSDWLGRVQDPATAQDAMSAAVQTTRNVTMKSHAKGKLVGVANAHNIDVIAQMMAKGNGARFTHLVDAPPQVENYDVSAEGFIAVSTIDAVRVFAMIGGVMSDNKLVGTGTLQEALAEHLKRKAR